MNRFFIFSLLSALILLGECQSYGESSKRPRRRRYRAGEYQLPIKGIKQTTLDEALRCKSYYLKQGDKELASKYLDRALSLAKDHKVRSELMLELADLYMLLEQRAKAAKLYNNYKLFYPGSSSIYHVRYQEIVANDLDALDSSKDQSKTKETVKLAKQFLQDFSHADLYNKQVTDILYRNYLKLMKSELSIASFYLNKYSYDSKESSLKAAHQRISYLLKEYACQLPQSQHLVPLEREIITAPLESYYRTLATILNKLSAYVKDNQEASRTFLSSLFTSKRHGKHAQRARR
jgi:outer membrane protein assembly factor BamD (BamD/ComL family)